MNALRHQYTPTEKVHVIAGKKPNEILERVCHTQFRSSSHPQKTSNNKKVLYFIRKKLISPFIERRRENGWGLYGLLNIQKGEKAKIAQQQPRNDEFFDTPVGLFFTVNPAMGISTKMDIAMMMQNVMITAKARDSVTCPQAA